MKIPGAGDLNRRISIRRWSEMPNAALGLDEVFGTPVLVWAEVRAVGGATYLGSMQLDATVTHRFIIRTGVDVSIQHVIEWSGRRYKVRRVNQMAGANHFTVIEAEELGAAT